MHMDGESASDSSSTADAACALCMLSCLKGILEFILASGYIFFFFLIWVPSNSVKRVESVFIDGQARRGQ